ncbi:MAG: OsmC family protein [Xanthomonadales bacterium]|nr:OsmC family protein [Xanthomonadales bacterium]
MSSHKATVTWERNGADFSLASYSRDHRWDFEGGESLGASAAPGYKGNPELVDPEQAFVASLSSCHMLTFLYLAAAKKLVINRYVDESEGFLGKNEQGKMFVERVVMRPRVEFEGDAPDQATLDQLHHGAHANCFIANSVTTRIDIE